MRDILPVFFRPSRLLAVLGVAATLAGCQSSDGAPADGDERASLLVRVAPAVPAESFRVRREFVGRVEAARTSDVGFELPGALAAVSVDEGAEVAGGAELARLDTARLQAALAEAEAALAEARSAAGLAERTLARNEEARAYDGISAQELDLARQQSAAAEARVAAALARVNAVRVDLAKARLVAPYAAVVVARHVDEGNIVAAGQPVLRLQELAPPEVRVGVAGRLASGLAGGQVRQLVVDGTTLDGRVRSVLPVRDPQTRTVDVILSLEASAGAVPGDLARLVLEETIPAPGLWLPATALAEGSRGLWTAYVAKELAGAPAGASGATHVLEARAVDVLHEDGDRVYVRGAIEAGERIVTGGLQRLVPNQEVRVADEVAVARRGEPRDE